LQALCVCVLLASGAIASQAAVLGGSPSLVTLEAPQIFTLGGSTLSIDRTELFSGTALQSFVLPIAVTSAGTVRVTLTDLTWPERLANLSFAATGSSQVLGRLDAPGVLSFAMAAAGNFSADVFGTPRGAASMGLFSLHIDFAPVPLPAAAWLLLTGLTGLGGIAGLGRRGFANPEA
jgi:hypothetical protein